MAGEPDADRSQAPKKTASVRYGRERRMRRRADFVRVQSHGERAMTPHFVLLVAASPLDARAHARLGVVATKKIGNAVARNRIKRVCRECFRLWPEFVPKGIDLVVIAKDGANELGLAQVRDEWTRARSRLLDRCHVVLARAAAAEKAAEKSAASAGKPKESEGKR
jgi:ribonuclease P protein component